MSRQLVESRLGPQWIRVRLQNGPHNGLTPDFCGQLVQVLGPAAANPAVRAILLESQGPNFCVGADLKWAQQQPLSCLSQLVRAMHQVCEIMLTAPKPVICAVHGAAAGGGMSMALCADVRLVTTKASFKLAYPQVGISMDGGSSFRLPQLLGLTQAQQLLYEDCVLSASTAHQLGLVHEVVPPERLEERACHILEQLASGPTLAYGESKRLMNPPELVRERLEKEAEAIDRMTATQDVRAGLEAFLNKSQPRFEGR